MVSITKKIKNGLIGHSLFSGLLILSIATLYGQPQQSDVDVIISNARSLPTEYKADILLRLVESKNISNPELRQEILTEVFNSAHEAKFPFAQVDANLSGNFDSVSTRLQVAFNQKLDGLSIQSRVVQLTLRDSPSKARQFWEKMNKPEIPRIPCESPTVANSKIYFETVVEVFSRGFSKKDRANGDDIVFLRNALTLKASVDDLVPLSTAIQTLPIENSLRLELIDSYTQHLILLGSEQDTDRQFSFAEQELKLSKQIQKMIGILGSRHTGEINSILNAYRQFLIHHFSTRRCQDTITVGVKPRSKPNNSNAGNEETSVSFFNEMLKSANSAIKPIVEEEIQLQGTPGNSAQIDSLNLSPLDGLLGNLMMKKNGKPADDPEFDNQGWENKILKILAALESTKNIDNQCEKCSFHEHALIYLLLVDKTDGYLQTQALNSLVRFLASSKLQQRSPIEWLDATKLLIRFTRPLSKEQQEKVDKLRKEGKILGMLPVQNGQRILDQMRNSGSPILATYAHLETIFPQPLDLPY